MGEHAIQDYDSFYNLMCSEYIDKNFTGYFYWYNNNTWIPKGRSIAQTTYPGMMFFTITIKRILYFLHIQINTSTCCLYMCVLSSCIFTLITYYFGKLMKNSLFGLAAAFFASITPATIVRSTVGTYDYECISINLIALSLYLYYRSIKMKSNICSFLSAIVFGFLALTWGGYIFIANIIPLYAIIIVIIGKFNLQLYESTSIWIVFSTLFAASVPTIGDKIITTPEHFLLFFSFFVINLAALSRIITKRTMKLIGLFLFIAVILLFLKASFSGRMLQIVNPLLAKSDKFLSSVGEQQPSAWSCFFAYCGPMIYLFPLGFYLMIRNFNIYNLFILLISTSLFYFSSIMSRILIVFGSLYIFVPTLAFDHLLTLSFQRKKTIMSIILYAFGIACLLHSVYITLNDGRFDILDFEVESEKGTERANDFREAYSWLRTNTERYAPIISWWDLGYQIQALAKRPVFHDGNTNNNTQIALIGLTYLLSEEESYTICKSIGAEYMMIYFGGASGIVGDDIAKLGILPSTVGQVYPQVLEHPYYVDGQPTIVGNSVSPATKNSTVFKLSYYNLHRFRFKNEKPGTDIARLAKIPDIDRIHLSKYQEVYTTKHWILRIYKIL